MSKSILNGLIWVWVYFDNWNVFVTLFPSITVNLPVLNTGIMPGIVNGIDKPLDFDLLEAFVTDFYAGQNLSRAITSKEKISLLVCAIVYDDKKLIDYIANLTCSDTLSFVNKETQERIKEFKKASSPTHGMETHRLQWHLIMLAAEKDIFNSIIPSDIPGLLQASVRVYGNLILWPSMFDNYPENKEMIHIIGSSCSFYLHSLIMLSNLHFLAACLFEKYTKSLAFLAKDAGHT